LVSPSRNFFLPPDWRGSPRGQLVSGSTYQRNILGLTPEARRCVATSTKLLLTRRPLRRYNPGALGGRGWRRLRDHRLRFIPVLETGTRSRAPFISDGWRPVIMAAATVRNSTKPAFSRCHGSRCPPCRPSQRTPAASARSMAFAAVISTI
jgi:hypothetical protein